MNNKNLKELKISKDYVIAPTKFLTMFSINCGSIRHVNLNKLSQFTNYQILEASTHLVNKENVLKGNIFLVGNLYKFKAFHRPIIGKLEDIDILNNETGLNDFTDSGFSSLYLDEMCSCSHNNTDEESKPNYQKTLVLSKKV